MDKPKDITYCSFKECKRDCERNIYKHNFKGQGLYSLARFDTAEGFEEDTCEYYYPMEYNYESSKM